MRNRKMGAIHLPKAEVSLAEEHAISNSEEYNMAGQNMAKSHVFPVSQEKSEMFPLAEDPICMK